VTAADWKLTTAIGRLQLKQGMCVTGGHFGSRQATDPARQPLWPAGCSGWSIHRHPSAQWPHDTIRRLFVMSDVTAAIVPDEHPPTE